MILYHASNTAVQTPDLSLCRPFKDFGRGFYLTSLPDQAEQMAYRTARIFGGQPIVTSYAFDDSALSSSQLKVKIFDGPSEEWALFVINNRDKKFSPKDSPMCNHQGQYDIVMGPVANDDLALLFRTFSRGLIDIEALVKGMRYKKLNNQYSFHSQKALFLLERLGDRHV